MAGNKSELEQFPLVLRY